MIKNENIGLADFLQVEKWTIAFLLAMINSLLSHNMQIGLQ